MSKSLPCPTERPAADVVLYDGECNFCRAGVQRLRWFDGTGGRLAFLSLHDPAVAESYPDVSLERLHEEMCVVDSRGQSHWGADAVKYLSRRLPRLWWLMPAMHFPAVMLLWRPLYRFVARNRYLIAGRNVSCEKGTCSIGKKSS